MNEVLLEVGAWSSGLSQVEVLLHTTVARLLPFVILVEKSMHGFRVSFLALVAEGVHLVVVVLGPRDLSQLLLIREITLGSVAHGHAVEVVASRVASEEAWLYRLVLVWNLFVQLVDARRHNESLRVPDAVLHIRKGSVLVRRVARGWRG